MPYSTDKILIFKVRLDSISEWLDKEIIAINSRLERTRAASEKMNSNALKIAKFTQKISRNCFWTIEEYNQDLEIGNSEIEQGDFITATNLKQEPGKW